MNKQRIAAELVKLAKELTAYPRIKWERSMFIPSAAKGAENVQKAKMPKDIDLEIYTYERDGKLFGVAFRGRAAKPIWRYRFRDERQRDKKIQDTIRLRQERLDDKRERQRQRREFKHDYQVGDILYASWGYDQTNIDFYEVVGTTEKSVVIREVASKIVKSKPPQDYVVPVPGKFTGSKMTKRVGPSGYVKVDSVARASRWDGRPMYQTSSGWGH